MVRTLVLSIAIIGVAFLLTPGYIDLMFEVAIELLNQWFWFVK